MRASPPGADEVDVTERLMRACFGVACPVHGRCARYAAVAHSAADPQTMVTCQRGTDFPLFLQAAAADAAAANDASTTPPRLPS